MGPHFAPHTLEAGEVLDTVGSNHENGLSEAEATARLVADGPNVLPQEPPTPLWRKILTQFSDPLVVLLLIAIAISIVAWILEGAHGAPVDAIVIALVIVLNAALGITQESQAAEAVAALQKMTEATAVVIRDGRKHSVSAANLVKGDLLVLAEGDQVAADARLLRADALKVIESSLTGESEPVAKTTDGVAEDAQIGDRTCMVFRGTAVARGSGLAVVTATGADTQMGHIATLLDSVEESPTPLQQETYRISKMLGIIVGIIAIVVVAVMLALGGASTSQGIIDSLLLGVSLAVAAVPEGLPAILSLVLALGVRRMADRNAVVKELTSVETLGSASVICSDKTGTLTRSEMTIQEVVTASGATIVSGVGYKPTGDLGPDEDRDYVMDHPELTGPRRSEVAFVLSGGALASDAELFRDEEGAWQVLGDPTEGAFLVAEKKLGVDSNREGRFTRVGLIPFTSERKLMSVIHRDTVDDAVVVLTKGAPDVLMERCTRIRIGDAVETLTNDMRSHMLDEVADMSSRALRTLAVAYRPLPTHEEDGKGVDDARAEQVESNLILVGVVGIIDPPRPEAAQAVAQARRAGIRVLMITGDHPATAGRIAEDLGIVSVGARVLTGSELSQMTPEQFDEAVRAINVYARVAPAHKMAIVKSLQAGGEIVAMTGDGVNDAPALRQADIGVAMGIAGTQVTKEAGAMVLADDNFATIVDAVAEGRRIFDNIRKFLRYLLSSNMGEVMTVFGGVLLAGLIGLTDANGAVVVPLVATQILWINLVTDSGPALAMGVDPASGDLMGRGPRRAGDRVIDGAMWTGVISIGAVMALVTLLTIDLFAPGGLLTSALAPWIGADSLDVARTAGFTTLVFTQLFNTVNSRSEDISAFTHLFTNKWLWASLALGVILQIAVVELPLLQTAFSTTSLQLHHWLICVALASCVLWFDELRKVVRRARAAQVGRVA